MQSNNPKICDDYYFNPLYTKAEDGFFVFGCRGKDSSVLLKKNKIELFKKFISALDGTNSIDDLVNKGYGSQVEIEKIIDLFSKKGLLRGSEKTDYFNEAEKFSVKLFHLEVRIKNEKALRLLRKFSKLYKYILPILFVTALIGIIMRFRQENVAIFIANMRIQYDSIYSSIALYILVNVFVVFMFIIHEFFHVCYGLRYHVSSFCISCVLFLGFIPMFYVKHNNIYALEKSQLLKVIAAGILGNIGLSFLFLSLFLFTNCKLFFAFVLSNIKIIYTNVIPVSLSDGYFFTTVLLGIPNIRLNMYKTLCSPKHFFTLDMKNRLCVITTIISLQTAVMLEALWVCMVLKMNHKMLYSILASFVALFIIHLISKRNMA